MRLFNLLLLSCALLAPIAAHATDFTFTGTLTNGHTLSGTFSLDATGDVTAADISGTPIFTPVDYNQLLNESNFSGLTVEQLYNSTDNSIFVLILPGNFTGGAVCSDNNLCAAGFSNYATYYEFYPTGFADLATGSAKAVTAVPTTGVSATPEPSSLVLLGTGIFGLTGAIRRKLRKA